MSLTLTLASLAAVGAMLVYVRSQRRQLQLLQRERSSASFSSLHGGAGVGSVKLASLQTFSLAAKEPHKTHAAEQHGKAAMLSIPNPWDD